MKKSRLPLTGIRVLDFCQMWAGPHATEWLSVMGAEVIKVESNCAIDYMRVVGAPADLAGNGPDVGSAFATLNWGKKSISLNMTRPEAQDLAKKLIKTCDVVAENFGGNILEKWGLSYAEMRKLKKDIIYYAGTGYGRSGPYKDRPAYAEIIDAFTGSTFVNGYPGGEPSVIGVSPWTDGSQAIHGSFAILAAIYHRMMTGEGQYIEAPMIASSANFLGELMMEAILKGSPGDRTGNHDAIMAPHGCYPCKNTRNEAEWIAISVANEKEWKILCGIMGNPSWSKSNEFSDELNRWKNQDQLDENLANWTRLYGSYELAAKLQKAGIAASASLSTKQLTHDKHLEYRKFFIQTKHPVLGNVLMSGLPVHFSSYRNMNYKRAPLLGEDNDYVFGELLGLTREEILKLIEDKVIY